ncbi:MAG: hydrogenase 3 maturation endopeptidase HyCI [Nitrospiraceae bacterium]|nr:hydrogenase 3 maturation endopeptidase HyCI [Nitrospiraceae bacterium]
MIITVGNSLRADDGVGPYISENLKNPNPKIKIMDAGERPEAIIDQAVELNPKKVIIIDAAHFEGTHGELHIIKEEDISHTILTTHAFPLNALAKIIADDTNAKVYFLGIQAKNTRLGKSLSEEVKKSADELIGYLNSE